MKQILIEKNTAMFEKARVDFKIKCIYTTAEA